MSKTRPAHVFITHVLTFCLGVILGYPIILHLYSAHRWQSLPSDLVAASAAAVPASMTAVSASTVAVDIAASPAIAASMARAATTLHAWDQGVSTMQLPEFHGQSSSTAKASAGVTARLSHTVVSPALKDFMYDIAMSSGPRPMFGATFGSCLVGLMASGAMLHARALHLLLSDAKLLNFSLVHNLAHMGTNVRVSLYDMAGASTSMRARNTFYQLLRVPDLMPGSPSGQTRHVAAESAVALGGSDLPTVLLEDDVWLVDDFPRKLHRIVSLAAQRAVGGLFVIKIYIHSGRYGRPKEIRALHAKTCNVSATRFPTFHQDGTKAASKCAMEGGPGATVVTAFPSSDFVGSAVASRAHCSGVGNGCSRFAPDDEDLSLKGYEPKPATYKWGAQGLYLSDGHVRRRLADCYLRFTARDLERQQRLKDRPLRTCLAQLNVSMFDSGRSLVQHLGAASSIFGNVTSNTRYHRACSFPFLERVPGEDGPGCWL